MVRRRDSKGKGPKSKPRGFNPKDSKLDRWERAEDIPLDVEDQFHASRDKILLEDDDVGGSDDGDEDEVFALKGMPDDSEEDDEDRDEEFEDGDDHLEELQEPRERSKKAKKKAKKGKAAESSESSDEESEEEEGWGWKKSAYYSSNAAQLDSEDEEANELEEQEAKRLQAKARDTLADDDFGLGDAVEVTVEEDDVLLEAPSAVQSLPQDKQALLRHLEKTNPEALALARDWDDVAHKLVKAQNRIAEYEVESPEALGLGMAHLHYQALLTYATTLAFYFHLRTSEKYVQRPELLRSHPVLPRLLSLKQSLATLEDLDFGLSDEDEDEGENDSDEEEEELDPNTEEGFRKLLTYDPKRKVGLDELEGLLREASEAARKRMESEQKVKRKTKAADAEDRPKKRRKTNSEPAKPVFDLVEPDLTARPASSSKRQPAAHITDVYGETTTLQAADAADKAARRKSLRFHTSRIENTSARRSGARNAAMGGDDDIPYRERKQQREERMAREAAPRRGQGGDDLDDVEPQPRKEKKRAREEDEFGSGSGSEAGGDASGYYDLVQRKSKEKKEQKKQEYEEAQAAARPVIDDSADGPRSLTRAILKNKGLTPHRGKSVRNPRVKKRQKYEKAKKRVASQKAVYKGGMDASRYDGEKTGITRTVKSVRL
ncbi:hypothetical protein CERSUDRAFT_92569 [Gelatoporia subvermispora B]|uniref:Sas10 C-terminal domain-containing protein n=1 Tax=Ceriporiopsis subvermispora (strain B) TaxID=914234 RepID=M2R662_CERS8|nr:hypothetical protein CERSUDRAFT_92569 [Gelatoporia subvermispora B]